MHGNGDTELVRGLMDYIDASPTPYHAVRESVRQLARAGFHELREADAWSVGPGDRVYLTRAGGTLAAFVLGSRPPEQGGFLLVGAHTDSPNLRIKPTPNLNRHGYLQLGVEVYGAALLSTWLDRDLSLAGRVSVRRGNRVESVLVDYERPMARIPNLCIHLNRNVNTEGLKLNKQSHLAPILGLQREGDFELQASLAEQLVEYDPELRGRDVLGWDLCLYDVVPPTISGREGEFIHAARLDNLASCHAGLTALLSAPRQHEACRGIVLYDHEEVGSQSAQGAASSFLSSLLGRLAQSYSGASSQAAQRAAARSFLISADMAHAVHPNYADRHDPQHRPLLGAGPVIKTHAGQAYASDSEGIARFRALCDRVSVRPQHFVTRSDLACGTTIGPMTAAQTGVRTVDVGSPLLSMHSIREMAASSDVTQMAKVLSAFFA